MTDRELADLVKGVSLEFFEEPGLVDTSFEHRATWNYRLSTTGGRFIPTTGNLEFNPKQLAHHGYQEFLGIIKHELVHYHLYRQGLPYKHGKEFRKLLTAVGGARFCKPTGAQRPEKTRYLYVCQKCGRNYHRKRKVDTNKFCCGIARCGGLLKKA